jgi:phage terminase large subunit-like protein
VLDSTSQNPDSGSLQALLRQLHEADLPPEQWEELLSLSLSAQAKDDVFKFGEYVFGHAAAAHHREMVDFIDGCVRDRKHGVILEPRGFAKSTWGTTINLSHRIGTEADLRVGLMSKSADHAAAFSRGIRWTLEKNERYHSVFGNLMSDAKWTDSEWLRRGSRWHGSQYASLYSQGVGGQIVSKRFDILHCDDILDAENTATRDQIAKVEDWFWQTLFPCLAPDGVAIVVGTRWAEGDLYETLIDKGWRVLKRSALVPGKKGKLESLWPELWPVKRLEELKEGMGAARFACAMLNDISGLMEGDVFQSRHFQYVDRLPDRPMTIRMGVDLATSTKERADWTACVVTAEDDEGNFFVLDFDRVKIASGHDKWIYDRWAAMSAKWGYVSLVPIESVQAQSMVVEDMFNRFPEVPVHKQPADRDKRTRATAVANRYEAGKVWHLKHLHESQLEVELTSFDRGHDDLVDSLGYSMQLSDRSNFVFGSLPR